jgi:hypothetical protein
MLTIYKNGKVITKVEDTLYKMTYEIEKMKENTPYNVPEENKGGLYQDGK